jgi:hypothetical protein
MWQYTIEIKVQHLDKYAFYFITFGKIFMCIVEFQFKDRRYLTFKYIYILFKGTSDPIIRLQDVYLSIKIWSVLYNKLYWCVILFVCLIGCYVTPTHYRVIWRPSSFTGGGRPRVPFCALFQAHTLIFDCLHVLCW